MYKRILCPVDGSETSNYGVSEAIALAKGQGAIMLFFHIIDDYIPIVDGLGSLPHVNVSDVLLSNAKMVLKKANDEAESHGVKAETKMIKVFSGNLADIIVNEAKDWDADIIVMGTHGLRGFDRLVMGSDAESVVRTSPVPVMLLNMATMKRGG